MSVTGVKYGSMPLPTSFHEFEMQRRAEGFDSVVERHWEPAAVATDHIHEFAAKALVVRGEMWLTVGGHTQHLSVGNTFELSLGVRHSERYGEQGATYWVARR